MSLIDAEMSRLKGLLRVTERERDRARQDAMLFVVGDLRQAAEAHQKSAEIEGRRLYRKNLYAIADVLNERADYYEKRAKIDSLPGAKARGLAPYEQEQR